MAEASFILRGAVGLILLVAAIQKLGATREFAASIEQVGLPEPAARAIAPATVLAELLVGTLLLVSLVDPAFAVVAGLSTTLLAASFVGYGLLSAARGVQGSCFCFGPSAPVPGGRRLTLIRAFFILVERRGPGLRFRGQLGHHGGEGRRAESTDAFPDGMTRRRVALSLALGAAAAVWQVGVAFGAFWFNLDPSSGPPGTTVAGRSVGQGSGTSAASTALPAYLVAQGEHPESGTRLPDVIVDSAGNVTVRFVVPNVPPGAYEVWVHCEPCGPTSGGRTDLPVASFTVTLGPPATDTEKTSLVDSVQHALPVLGTWAVVSIAASAWLVALFRRHRRDRSAG